VNLDRNSRWLDREKEEKLEWRETWRWLDKNKGKNCTSREKNKRWTFQVRCLGELLPTLTELNIRCPKVYKSNTCIICKKKAEDIDHLVNCTAYQNIWNIIEEEASEEGLKTLKREGTTKNLDDKKTIKDLFFDKTLETRRCLVRSLITKKKKIEIEEKIEDTSTTRKVIDTIKGKFDERFRTCIWNFRCELLND